MPTVGILVLAGLNIVNAKRARVEVKKVADVLQETTSKTNSSLKEIHDLVNSQLTDAVGRLSESQHELANAMAIIKRQEERLVELIQELNKKSD